MNQLLIQNFQKLIQEKNNAIKTLKDQKADKKEISLLNFKVINFRKVLKIIQEYPEPITEGKQLQSIKGIGKGAIERIDEILQNGTLEEVTLANNSESEKEILIQITGIGPSKAEALIKLGITFPMLESEMKKIKYDLTKVSSDSILSQLTHHQLIGLKYFNDISQRIPRLEIQKIEKKLKQFISEIDPKLEVIICGSYRRGLPDSGDIDMLVLHPNLTNPEEVSQSDTNYLKTIVQKLTEKKLLVDHLTEDGNTKYMGLGKLSAKSTSRRVDIRFIPYQSKGAAMLYFTGSGTFNTEMRKEALKKGYTINEYGIYTTKKENRKTIKDKLVPSANEKDIFDLVGMKYLEPPDRK